MGVWEKLQKLLTANLPRRSDVTNYEALQATFDDIVKDFGRIDGL